MYQGIEENLALITQLYGPAWSMRVYYTLDDKEDSATMSFLCRLHRSTFYTIRLDFTWDRFLRCFRIQQYERYKIQQWKKGPKVMICLLLVALAAPEQQIDARQHVASGHYQTKCINLLICNWYYLLDPHQDHIWDECSSVKMPTFMQM